MLTSFFFMNPSEILKYSKNISRLAGGDVGVCQKDPGFNGRALGSTGKSMGSTGQRTFLTISPARMAPSAKFLD